MESSSSPVFIFVKAKGCAACENFVKKYWTNFQKALTVSYPLVKVAEVSFPSLRSALDTTTTPSDLAIYIKHFPMFFLVPGSLWSRAMKKLGPHNNVSLAEGIRNYQGHTTDINGLLDWIGTNINDTTFKEIDKKYADNTVPDPVKTIAPTAPKKALAKDPTKDDANNGWMCDPSIFMTLYDAKNKPRKMCEFKITPK